MNAFTNPGKVSPVPEKHVPVNGYNAAEVEAAMKAPVEPAPKLYVPTSPPNTQAATRKDGRTPPAPWAPSAPATPKERMYCSSL